jgi:hypothetical protein
MKNYKIADFPTMNQFGNTIKVKRGDYVKQQKKFMEDPMSFMTQGGGMGAPMRIDGGGGNRGGGGFGGGNSGDFRKDGRKSKRGSKKKQQPDRITIKINPEDWFFRVFYLTDLNNYFKSWLKVSPCRISPVLYPFINHSLRCADDPCVKLS